MFPAVTRVANKLHPKPTLQANFHEMSPIFSEKSEPSLKELGWFFGVDTSMLLAIFLFERPNFHEMSPITRDLQPESWIFVVGFGSIFFLGQTPLFWLDLPLHQNMGHLHLKVIQAHQTCKVIQDPGKHKLMGLVLENLCCMWYC